MSSIIYDILSREDDFSVLMGDIIRVLSLYFGQLWLSELILELDGFRASLGNDISVDEEEVERAINQLEIQHIISVEERLRSSLLSGSIPDKMIKLLNFDDVLNIVKRDKRYMRYVKLREKALEELRR